MHRNRRLASYTYTDDAYHRLQSVTYGNSDKVEYTYDDLGRVTKEIYYENGSTTVSRTITYEYNASGALATVKDSKTGITTKHYYDTVGRSTGMYESGGSSTHRLKYTYDGPGRLQKTTETCGNSTYTTEYGYYGDGKVETIQTGDSGEKYVYDAYGRLDCWYTFDGEIPRKDDGSVDLDKALIYKNIHYEAPDDRSTSSRPEVWGYTSGKYSVNYTYGYDGNGNIVSEKVDGKTTTYVYDSANQLIRENNEAAGRTWVYTYDDAGNILTKKEYAYTTGTLGSVMTSNTYTYGNANWGDLLTKYNGVSITYDSIGNPLSDGTWTYSWQEGRKLASMSKSGTTWTYTYDANGMRTRRTNGTSTYNYTYHGDQLTHMTYGSNVLHFYYDASGKPLSVVYNGTTYYYVLNLQGDVVAILDSSGNQVVGYRYDAWGRLLATTGTMAPSLGLHNPLRYRGYVYDRETGLYYLQSRYYNPEIGRFINADDIDYLGADGSPLSYNLYAYCNNNPVRKADASGNFGLFVGTMIVGAIVNVVTTYIAAKVTGQDYTITDGLVAATAGAVNAIPGVGPVLNGVISGGYAAYVSYQQGATVGETVISGLVTGVCAIGSISNLASLASKGVESGLSIMAAGFVDLIFGTGYNTIAAATTKGVIDNAQKRP